MKFNPNLLLILALFPLLGGCLHMPWDNADQQSASAKDSQKSLTSGQEPAAQSTDNVSSTRKGTNQNIKIYFEHNSNELTSEALQKLNRVAEYLAENPKVDAAVKGYTDSWGDYNYNVMVADFRATTVKMYLVGKGIAASRITAVGIGPKDFIAGNDTFEGRSQNRRVEIEYQKRPAP